MNKRKRILKAITSIILIAAMTYTSVFATVSEEKGNLSDLNDERESIANQQQELEANKSKTENYIKDIDNQLTKLATDIYKTGQRLEKTQTQIDKTTKKLHNAEESITVQYADMKLRIKYMYENGDTQMLDLILNSKSITDFLNKAEYITELTQYDRQMLDKMKRTKQEIADAQALLKKDKKELLAMQNKQKKDKSSLERLSDSKKAELASYDALLDDNKEAQADLDRAIMAQEQRVADAERESREAAEREKVTQPPVDNGGSENNGGTVDNKPSVSGYTWPCPGYKYVSSNYGYRSDPFTGETKFHSGIDVPAPSGTPVVAAASGTVEWSEHNWSAGNWIGINHGNGVYTIYMHMSALLVSPGAYVNKGQAIGLVGTTGSSTGNHLHFSIRKNGVYVSPWQYVG